MGSLLLVRHGQASFGADDYDQLSELGRRQCHRLGEHLREHGHRVDAVLRGTLRRHRQSLEALAEGLGGAPEALEWPGLNEYDSEALIRAVHPGPLERPTTPEAYRQHFRLLRQGLDAWMQGRVEPTAMPAYRDFVAGVLGALDHVRQHHADGQVLIVSSGGPIGTAVAQVLGAPHTTAIDLNMRLRNSAVTELVVSRSRHALLSFNGLPHLEAPDRRDWITYA